MFDVLRIIRDAIVVNPAPVRAGAKFEMAKRETERQGRTVKDRELFHPEAADISLDAILGALSDPIRRDVLRRIADEGALYCGDLSYDVVKSTMSHHFRVLRESGLMHTEREGKHRRITRRDDVIEQRFPGLLAAVGLPAGKGQWPD